MISHAVIDGIFRAKLLHQTDRNMMFSLSLICRQHIARRKNTVRRKFLYLPDQPLILHPKRLVMQIRQQYKLTFSGYFRRFDLVFHRYKPITVIIHNEQKKTGKDYEHSQYYRNHSPSSPAVKPTPLKAAHKV
jgi:hypothetical protein